jgi:lauroyl/myristoyl acyltransferase
MLYLAHQANASIIPFIHLYQRGKMTLIFKDPLDEEWRDGEIAYQRIVKEFVKLLEAYILKYPEQYMGIYGPTVLANYYRDYQ